MAATLTDFTLEAGFTSGDVIDKLGEALHHLGFLPTATGWGDDHTFSNGIRQVAFSQSIGSGPRSEWTHVFSFNPMSYSSSSNYHALYYIGGYFYDASTHRLAENPPEIEGGSYWDAPYSLKTFDNITSSTTLSRYAAGLSNFFPSGPMTITAITPTSGKMKFIWIHGPQESRVYGFYDANATLNPDLPQPFDNTGSQFCALAFHFPSGNYTSQIFGQALAVSLCRSQCGIGNVDNQITNGGGYWVPDEGISDLIVNTGTNSFNAYQVMLSYCDMRPPSRGRDTDYTTSSTFAQQLQWPYTASALEVPVSRHVYTDVHTGEVGWMTVSSRMNIAPAVGDRIVVAAGGEEYLILKASTKHISNQMSYCSADYVLLVVRDV